MAGTFDWTDVEFDLSDESFVTDREAGERWIGAPRPVCPGRFSDGNDVYVVTRYEAVRSLFADRRVSNHPPEGVHLDSMRRRGVPEELLKYFDSTIMTMVPDDHRRVRALIDRAFSLRRVRSLRPRIEALASDLLDRMDPGGEADLVADYAHPISTTVICELLGVDDEYRDQWLKWTEAFTTFIRPDPKLLPPALRGMVDTVVKLIHARRVKPGDDLISDLVRVSDETEQLDEVELVALVLVLVQAGLDTVRHSISLSFFYLLSHPEQLELVRTQPEHTGRAVRELMRYSGPIKMALPRFAVEPIEIDGVTIPKDGQIQLVVGAANNDPERFADPRTLDVTRADNPQLSFAAGDHYCPGAALATAETEIALNELFARFPGVRLAADPEEVGPRFLRAVSRLPVRLR
ncbi:cytochrome P450 family protein [Micromonospora rubida]|uniref:cytochrome P450 family protein n=1 Tax=Micromonospora rubida TaxID=2697657 RepID=UPI0013773286|nr:cytochrome P450 [Micromonospora rubida]NBE80050.1 cytochrome P450 [Micromonospora rubida]